MAPSSILLVATLFLFGTVYGQSCPHNSGSFDSTLTNSNIGSGSVTLSVGRHLWSDPTPTSLTSLTIPSGSELVFDNRNADISLEWLRVQGGGKLTMGSSSSGCSITSKIVVTFTGGFDDVSNPLGSNHGTKGIAVDEGGSLQLFGAIPTNTWTHISGTIQAGSTSFSVQDSLSGWSVGDKIVLTSTDFGEIVDYQDMQALVDNGTWTNDDVSTLGWLRGRGAADQNEELTITSISGSTITVAEPIEFMHWGNEGEYFAEVGLLTRNIVLQGDADSDNTRFGMHLLIRAASQAEIQGVEFFRGGQQAVVGRYPIHFHLIGSTAGNGMHATGNSIHRSYQRCVTIHDTHSVVVKDNVAWDIWGHCYFLEDGSELYNRFERNLGVYVKPIVESEGQIIPTDDEPSVFWISNPLNDFIENVAVGGKFGFWYVFPEFPNGASESLYAPGCGGPPYCPSADVILPRLYPHGLFVDNVAHSSSDTGLEIDNMQDENRESELAPYDPHDFPFVIPNGTTVVDQWDVDTGPAIIGHFLRYVAYKNRQYGVWARGGPLDFDGFVLMDNQLQYNAPPGPTLLRDSLVVGETDNVGTRRQGGSLDDYNNGRSNPTNWNSMVHIIGQESYDNGGPQYVANVEFRNFEHSIARPAGVHSGLHNAPFVHQTKNKYYQSTYEDANMVSILPATADQNNQVVYLDLDGEITGMSPNGWIVANHDAFYALQSAHAGAYDFNTTYDLEYEFAQGNIGAYIEGSGWMLEPDAESCEWQDTWNAYACPVHGPGYVQLRMNNEDVASTHDPSGLYSSGAHMKRVEMHQLRGAGKSGWASGDLDGNEHQFQFNLAPRTAYVLKTIDGSATAPSWTISMESSFRGDWMVLGLPYADVGFSVQYRRWGNSPTDLPQADSLAQLGANGESNWFYDSATQTLWLMLTQTANRNYYDDDFYTFTDYDFDGSFYTIQASCSGASCASSNTDVPAAPAVAEDFEDSYQAELCGSDGHAMAFAYYSPETNALSSSIYHTETNLTSDVYIRNRLTNRRATPPMLGLLSSPVRQSEVVSYDVWKQLFRGELEVVVEHDGATLTGPLRCSEEDECRPPSGVPDISSACTDAGKLVVADDGPVDGSGWYIGVYDEEDGASLDQTYTTDSMCGTSSFQLVQGDYDGIYMGPTPDPVDVSGYTHFEFYVKGTAETPQVELRCVQLRMASVSNAPCVDVTKEHISTIAIDDLGWSRVRMSLDEFNLPTLADFDGLSITVGDQQGETITYLLDRIQFVNVQGADLITDALSPSESGSDYRPRNCASSAVSLEFFWEKPMRWFGLL